MSRTVLILTAIMLVICLPAAAVAGGASDDNWRKCTIFPKSLIGMKRYQVVDTCGSFGTRRSQRTFTAAGDTESLLFEFNTGAHLYVFLVDGVVTAVSH